VGITSENDESKIKKFIAGMGNDMKYPVALDKYFFSHSHSTTPPFPKKRNQMSHDKNSQNLR